MGAGGGAGAGGPTLPCLVFVLFPGHNSLSLSVRACNAKTCARAITLYNIEDIHKTS